MTIIIQPNYISDGINYALLAGFGADVLANDTVTSGSFSQIYQVAGARQIDLITAVIGTVTGTTPQLQMNIQALQVDTPTGVVNLTATSISALGAAEIYYGGILDATNTRDIITVRDKTIGDFVQINWNVAGTTPSFAGVYSRMVIKK